VIEKFAAIIRLRRNFEKFDSSSPLSKELIRKCTEAGG
jgi:hypothetical protein